MRGGGGTWLGVCVAAARSSAEELCEGGFCNALRSSCCRGKQRSTMSSACNVGVRGVRGGGRAGGGWCGYHATWQSPPS
jgi:hypothetical protein